MLDADEVPAGALLLAAVGSRNEMMLEDALKRPQKESDMAGAVQVACESGQTSMLRKMLHAGVKPGRHALWAACWSGHAETARALVETGGMEITDTERSGVCRLGPKAGPQTPSSAPATRSDILRMPPNFVSALMWWCRHLDINWLINW